MLQFHINCKEEEHRPEVLKGDDIVVVDLLEEKDLGEEAVLELVHAPHNELHDGHLCTRTPCHPNHTSKNTRADLPTDHVVPHYPTSSPAFGACHRIPFFVSSFLIKEEEP